MTDENEQEGSTATEPVTVPNVTPGAVSGTAHEPLGSDASAPDVDLDATEGSNDGVVGLEVELPEPAPEEEPADEAEAVEVPGVLVESDTAGTGEAVNADTGEVTQPGEPLPPVEDDGDGTPLDPPQTDAPDDEPAIS